MKLREEDLEISHLKGSGPGGQNRNKRFTGVRVVHRPTGISAMATEWRSQSDNLRHALERISKKVAAFFHVPKTRRPTRRTKASGERRILEKKRRSKIKHARSSREES